MRLHQLDSLRGLAALTVMIGHFIVVFPIMEMFTYNFQGNDTVNLLKYTPLHFFWAAHEAVIFFFLLSGFVLSLPFFRGKVHYGSYLVKRICRIYIPYIIIVVFAIFMKYFTYQGSISSLSNTINSIWNTPFTFSNLLGHLFLIGEFDYHSYDAVIWSLVHEMRISILFPIIMFFIVKRGWVFNSLVALVLPILYLQLEKIFPSNIPTNYNSTLHFISFFIIGALLAKYRIQLTNFFTVQSKVLKISVLIIGILFYTYSWWFYPGKTDWHSMVLNDWMISIGAALFIILSLSSQSLSKVLLLKPISFLGKVSYSLYLIHIIVLVSVLQLFNGHLPLWGLLAGAFGLSIFLSYIAYLFIELPSIRLGKWLTAKKKYDPVIEVKDAV